jgi:hypothetical protein
VATASHLRPPIALLLQRPQAFHFQRPPGREDWHLQGQLLLTSLSPVSVLCPSKVYLSVVLNRRHSLYDSFATTSDRSTLVDQPTIMLRSVPNPWANDMIGVCVLGNFDSATGSDIPTKA